MRRLAVLLLLAGCGEADLSTWRGKPPERYQGTATATVAYHPAEAIRQVCGAKAVGCYTMRAVYLPDECGKGVRTETVNVREMLKDRSYCASLKAHEFGHVNGWSAQHER